MISKTETLSVAADLIDGNTRDSIEKIMSHNCQAMCDVRLRFLYFGVVAPGKTDDNSAYPRCTALKQFIDNLPIGLYVVGDAVYTLSEKLMIPFTGPQKQDPNKDTSTSTSVR